jgi:hypothetical protein
LPVSDQLLKSKVVENVTTNLKNERDREKRYYDQHTASLPKLSKGDHVMAKTDPKANWQPAKVKKRQSFKAKSITFDESSRTKFHKRGDKINSYVWRNKTSQQ